MSVDQTNVVDFIGVETATGHVVLTISDHLPWDDESEHLQILEDKVNSYVAFIESGELVEKYPKAVGRTPKIEVFFKYDPTKVALEKLARAREQLLDARIEFGFSVHSENQT